MLNLFYFGNPNNESTPIWQLWLYIGSLSGLMLLLILSGIWQLIAIFRLRRILRTDRHAEKINLSTLKIHIAAFGLFMVSQFFYLIVTFQFARTWTPDSKSNWLYTVSYFSFTIGTFVSQSLIAFILFQLAKKKDVNYTMAANEQFFPTLVVEEFDETAELQGRIWN